MAKKLLKEKNIEETLWESANKLRGSVEPAEYKHVVLGLIFLKFASDKFEEHRKNLIAEGKGKGEFYTPKTIVNLIAEMIEPYKGIIYDPACGSGGMFVQSIKFIENHHGNKKEVSIYGQEYTNTTYKLAKMNLAIRGIAANLGEKAADTFGDDQHKDLKADYIMANPPFNQKDWRGENELIDDPRWRGYDVPPKSNANYGWILNKNKKAHIRSIGDETRQYRQREDEILFMDLRQLGEPFEKKFTQFSDEDIQKVTSTYHTWQTASMINDQWLMVNDKRLMVNKEAYSDINHLPLTTNHYKDIPEFCYSASFDEVAKKDFSLVPSKYIEFVNRDENIDFDEKMKSLQAEFAELLKAEAASKADLLSVFKELGYQIDL
jgi:type I restriction enzyme M protein